MTNAELFKQTFGRYATEVWSLPEDEFLEWLNADVQQKTGRWIPCSERLPKESGIYLVSMNRIGYPQREVDGFVRGIWERFGNNVIAWCEIPEPYVPDTNDGKMKEGDKH